MKDNNKVKGNKQFSAKSPEYTQETSKELGATVPTGYVSPEKMAKEAYNQQGSKKQDATAKSFNQEAASEFNVNKVMKAGKDSSKKNQ